MDNVSRSERLNALAAQGRLIAYFGYGSLVNPFTHRTEIVSYSKARLRGWRRRWQARPDVHPDPIAFLTSAPIKGPQVEQSWLDGLLVFDTVDNLPALDMREAGYDRRRIDADNIISDNPIPENCPLYAYEGRGPAEPAKRHAILQSYLDAVLQGYHLMYGDDGVRAFVGSTDHFDTPILRDRANPRYPRHISLDPLQKSLIDGVTAHLNFVESL